MISEEDIMRGKRVISASSMSIARSFDSFYFDEVQELNETLFRTLNFCVENKFYRKIHSEMIQNFLYKELEPIKRFFGDSSEFKESDPDHFKALCFLILSKGLRSTFHNYKVLLKRAEQHQIVLTSIGNFELFD